MKKRKKNLCLEPETSLRPRGLHICGPETFVTTLGLFFLFLIDLGNNNINIVQKKGKKMYLRLEMLSTPCPFSCSYCCAAAVPAGVDEDGGVGRVDGGHCK